jgi:hypothetical protein
MNAQAPAECSDAGVAPYLRLRPMERDLRSGVSFSTVNELLCISYWT